MNEIEQFLRKEEKRSKYEQVEKRIQLYTIFKSLLNEYPIYYQRIFMNYSEEQLIDLFSSLEKFYCLCKNNGFLFLYSEVMEKGFTDREIILEYLLNHSDFTEYDRSEDRIKGLKNRLNLYCNKIKSVSYQEPYVTLQTSFGKVRYSQASDLFLRELSSMKNAVLIHRQIGTKYRCHELSYDFICTLFGTAITGMVRYPTGKVLHSWIENNDICIDIAHNLVLEKLLFNQLYQPEEWNRINFQEIQEKGIPDLMNPEDRKDEYGYYSLCYLAVEKHLQK